MLITLTSDEIREAVINAINKKAKTSLKTTGKEIIEFDGDQMEEDSEIIVKVEH